METFKIIETVNKLFIGADEKNWKMVSSVFNDKVWLDYTSMTGGEPAELTSGQIIDSWKASLPGFDKIHHQLGNYIVTIEADVIKVFCYVTATHYLKNDSGNNVWVAVGTYNLELKTVGLVQKITKMKFNLKFMDGNLDLPKLAQERMKK